MALVSIKLLQAAFEPKHIAAALDKWPQPQRHNQASDSQSFTTDKKMASNWVHVGCMALHWHLKLTHRQRNRPHGMINASGLQKIQPQTGLRQGNWGVVRMSADAKEGL